MVVYNTPILDVLADFIYARIFIAGVSALSKVSTSDAEKLKQAEKSQIDAETELKNAEINKTHFRTSGVLLVLFQDFA